MSTSKVHSKSPVTVTVDELRAGSVTFTALEEAFGPSSMGIIMVKDLPSEFAKLRRTLLSYSSYLACLPAEELAKLESPAAKWLVGWSCGKETLKDGRYDIRKGSYYVNCAPAFEDASQRSKLAEAYPDLPEYTAANIWPTENVLPGFEKAFRALCTLIVDTAALVARACDRYAEVHVGVGDGGNYTKGYLEHVVRTSLTTKARLLHYFPSKQAQERDKTPSEASFASASIPDTNSKDSPNDRNEEQDDWCATHLDHGCLTGLTSAMFVNEDDFENTITPSSSKFNSTSITSTSSSPLPALPELPSPPDPAAGLYIHARDGTITKVSIPRDCLAFQTGEALEVITKGKFRAVPHFVRGVSAGAKAGTEADLVSGSTFVSASASATEITTTTTRASNVGGTMKGSSIARNTLAIFTQPNLWEMVDDRRDFATFAREIVDRNH